MERAPSKVLVVKRRDQVADARSIQDRLISGGYCIAEAQTVAEAWKEVQTDPELSAIVCATELPPLSGWELAQRVRTDQRFDRIGFVLVADYHDVEESSRAAELSIEYLSLIAVDDLNQVVGAAIAISQRTETRTVRVLMRTLANEIECDLHLPPHLERFSDGWELIMNDGRAVLPVTNAVVRSLDGGGGEVTTAFMQITKSQVQWVSPVDDGLTRQQSADVPQIQRGTPDPATAPQHVVERLQLIAAELARALGKETGSRPEDVLMALYAHLEERPAEPLPAEAIPQDDNVTVLRQAGD